MATIPKPVPSPGTWTVTLQGGQKYRVGAVYCVVNSGALTFKDANQNVTWAVSASEWRAVQIDNDPFGNQPVVLDQP